MAAVLGREHELARLLEAFEHARKGSGRLVLLIGEPGIGKTRLADELCARVRANASVQWGRCWEAGGAPAYWPWIQALRGVVAGLTATEVKGTLAAAGTDLTSLLPELRDSANARASTLENTAEARFRLFDSISSFLRHAAGERALVLVLDDLHVADLPSLLLLRFVARNLSGSRVLLIGTYRDVEARLSADVSTILADIERDAEHLIPRRLLREEIAQFVRDVCSVELEGAALDALVRSTEGNPLFVNEAVRLAWAEGSLQAPSGTRLLAFSRNVDGAIRGRLARLREAARATLTVAAVIGREFELELLRAATGEPHAALLDQLDEAILSGIVNELEGAAPRFRFSHFLVREALYRDLDAAARTRLHAAVARGLEGLCREGAENHVVELAHHCLLAGDAGDRRAATEYCLRAGERARSILAYEEASNWLERALESLEPADEPGSRRAEILLLLGEARMRAGDRRRARQACEQAAAEGRRLGASDLIARAALILGAEFVVQVVDRSLVDLLQEALSGLHAQQHAALRLRVMARLAAALQPAEEPNVPTAFARAAIAEARSFGDPRTLAQVLHAARAAYMPLDDVEERLAIDVESLALAYETDQRSLALQARQRLVHGTLEIGDTLRATVHLDAYERLAVELRSSTHRFAAVLARHALAGMTGRVQDTQRLFEEAQALSTHTSDPNAKMLLEVAKMQTARALCRHAHLTTALDDFATKSAHLPLVTRLAQVQTLVRIGSVEALRGAFELLRPEALPERLGGQGPFAEVCWRLGDKARAAMFYERLLPWALRFQAYLLFEGSFSRPLALLAMTLERWDDARRHFEDALARNEVIGARPWWAQTAADYAELLRERGSTAERARAVELARRALSIARELDMTDLLPRLDLHRRKLELPSAAPDLSTALRRQGDYWNVCVGSQSFSLKDSRGLRMLSRLVQHPGREFHVLELSGLGERDAVDTGDAGPVLDKSAKSAYQRRSIELRAELQEAERWHDLARVTRCREELEFLSKELAAGVGIGARERKAASAVERARVNVQRRLTDAIRKISEHAPRLGAHLSQCVKTGVFCAYRPL